jgi:hypothetical protein
MAILEDMLKGNAVIGIGVGLGALLLAPTVLPAIGRVLRPAAKAAIKGGMVFYRETVSEIGEVASDLFEEARAELEQGSGQAKSGAATRGSSHARSEGH